MEQGKKFLYKDLLYVWAFYFVLIIFKWFCIFNVFFFLIEILNFNFDYEFSCPCASEKKEKKKKRTDGPLEVFI